MRLVISILFLIPLLAVGQNRKKAKEKARADSLWQMTIKSMDHYDLDSNGYHNKLVADTIRYDNKQIKAIGSFAFDKYHMKGKYKVGPWTEYYENGKIKSTGQYQMAYVFACRSATLGLSYYSYKVGYWSYYYENGQLKAVGKYELTTQKVSTGIADQYAKKSIITPSWLLYENNGQASTNHQKFVSELEKM